MIPTTHSAAPIRVLIVDDSTVMRTTLSRMMESDHELQVVGVAVDGIDALEQIKSLQPDVVTLDIEMPRMNGIETLTRIMAESPRPVIMISGLTREGARVTLDALDRGAFDFIAKPSFDTPSGIFQLRDVLLAKIKAAAQSPLAQSRGSRKAPARTLPVPPAKIQTTPTILAIGASTGGPKALQEILVGLPADLPTGVLIVQHMPIGFSSQFAERLNRLCKLAVRESTGEETITPGTVYIAPAGWHMTVSSSSLGYRTHLSKSPGGTQHIPSVDILMLSVANVFSSRAMGILLTGMGSDGARGMKAIREAGGWTVGQDAESCAVYGMPRSAAGLGALCRVVPLAQMSSEIMSALSPRANNVAPLTRSHTAP
jgi:two-component system chemotaxis response regulator CheB